MRIENMKEFYIPVTTDDFRIAFCQVTKPLCTDVQQIIWKEVLYCTEPIEPPPTPVKKCPIIYDPFSISLPKNLFHPKKVLQKI